MPRQFAAHLSTPSTEARQAADRLRQKLAEAGGATLTLDAERVERLAELLDRLGGRETPPSDAPISEAPVAENVLGGWAPTNRVEQDLAALLMRSAVRGRDSDWEH